MSDALQEHLEKVESLVYVALSDLNVEYIFSFDNGIPKDQQEYLIYRSIRSIEKGKDLPANIKLKKIIRMKPKYLYLY